MNRGFSVARRLILEKETRRCAGAIVVLVLVFSAFLLASTASVRAEKGCSRSDFSSALPVVKMAVLPESINLIRTVSRDKIADYFIGPDGTMGRHAETTPQGMRTVGLTNAHFLAQFKYSAESLQNGDGTWCVNITKLELTLGFEGQDVYIPSEYAPGTCQYDEILGHEMTHVKINQSTLEHHVERIHMMAIEHLIATGPMLISRSDDLQDEANRRVDMMMNSLLADFEADRMLQNRELDSEENYRALTALCETW